MRPDDTAGGLASLVERPGGGKLLGLSVPIRPLDHGHTRGGYFAGNQRCARCDSPAMIPNARHTRPMVAASWSFTTYTAIGAALINAATYTTARDRSCR